MSPNASSSYTVPLLVGGKDRPSATSFPITSPETGETLHQCSNADVADAEAAVEAAAAALDGWRAQTPRARRDILLKAAAVLEARREELAGYMRAETGATAQWANFNLDVARDLITDVAGRISSLGGLAPATQDPGVGALVLKEPYGVVLAMAPWNAPYILGVRSVALPLAAGNTVVFKGSELSPRTMWGIASAFADAGLPAGALNLVFASRDGAAAVTGALIAHPAVRKINFTGSTGVGRIVARLAGDCLKPVLLELGGKAPAVVWEDADLDLAADQCALGAFLNAGQICMSTERVVVHKKVAAEFRAKFAASADRFFAPGGPAPVLVQAQGVARNRALVRDAIAKGAEVVLGDAAAEEASAHQMRPVALSGVTPDMDIYRAESFGPTVSLFEVESEDEAVRLANDTEYGLTAAVFTEDLRRGLRIAGRIESGAVHINNMTVHDEPGLPHGGAKSSGYGRFNASGLEEWVKTKVVTYRV
ncbi:hypothetical protein RB595_002706 [Gaeumannomyces hyphopodioides]